MYWTDKSAAISFRTTTIFNLLASGDYLPFFATPLVHKEGIEGEAWRLLYFFTLGKGVTSFMATFPD